MTDTINEARALLARATPAPWRCKPTTVIHRGTVAIEEDGQYIETIAEVYCGAAIGHGADNAALIAAAPRLLADLCDELEAAHKALAAAQQNLDVATGAVRLGIERDLDRMEDMLHIADSAKATVTSLEQVIPNRVVVDMIDALLAYGHANEFERETILDWLDVVDAYHNKGIGMTKDIRTDTERAADSAGHARKFRSEEVLALLDAARSVKSMPEMRDEQRRSSSYGNDAPTVTRATIDEAAERSSPTKS